MPQGVLTKETHTRILCVIFLLSLGACAGKRAISFVSTEPGSQISLVPLSSTDAEGQKLRNPAKLDTAQLQSNAVRISSAGKASQYWFAPGDQGNQIQITVKRLPSCESAEGNRNRPVRVLLKAYQALYSRNYRLAREMASRASVLDPTLAAPFIITGLAYLREGNKERARGAFSQAQSLDPEDGEIGKLLRAVQ